jgi:hypothetical protein
LQQLTLVVDVVNGSMRTPKINQVKKNKKLVLWLNIHAGSQQILLRLNTSCMGEDAWLSGFIDADGSFAIVRPCQHLKRKGVWLDASP